MYAKVYDDVSHKPSGKHCKETQERNTNAEKQNDRTVATNIAVTLHVLPRTEPPVFGKH